MPEGFMQPYRKLTVLLDVSAIWRGLGAWEEFGRKRLETT
jgi:hypothetical protein